MSDSRVGDDAVAVVAVKKKKKKKKKRRKKHKQDDASRNMRKQQSMSGDAEGEVAPRRRSRRKRSKNAPSGAALPAVNRFDEEVETALEYFAPLPLVPFGFLGMRGSTQNAPCVISVHPTKKRKTITSFAPTVVVDDLDIPSCSLSMNVVYQVPQSYAGEGALSSQSRDASANALRMLPGVGTFDLMAYISEPSPTPLHQNTLYRLRSFLDCNAQSNVVCVGGPGMQLLYDGTSHSYRRVHGTTDDVCDILQVSVGSKIVVVRSKNYISVFSLDMEQSWATPMWKFDPNSAQCPLTAKHSHELCTVVDVCAAPGHLGASADSFLMAYDCGCIYAADCRTRSVRQWAGVFERWWGRASASRKLPAPTLQALWGAHHRQLLASCWYGVFLVDWVEERTWRQIFEPRKSEFVRRVCVNTDDASLLGVWTNERVLLVHLKYGRLLELAWFGHTIIHATFRGLHMCWSTSEGEVWTQSLVRANTRGRHYYQLRGELRLLVPPFRVASLRIQGLALVGPEIWVISEHGDVFTAGVEYQMVQPYPQYAVDLLCKEQAWRPLHSAVGAQPVSVSLDALLEPSAAEEEPRVFQVSQRIMDNKLPAI